MSRRFPTLRRDWLWIALFGLLVQGFWAVRLHNPTYMDAYYYTISGQALAAGQGFKLPVVWQFLDNPITLPAPSHTYWMPLPALLAASGYLFSHSFRAAQFPFWLLSGLLPLLSYAISWQLSGERWQAWTAALLTAAGGYYAAYLSQPTTFAPFAWAGGLGLLLMASAPSQKGWFIAGILAGLAHLTRADGFLFLLVGVLLLLHEQWQMRDEKWTVLMTHLSSLIPNLSLLILGYLLIMTPWFWHNIQVIGRPLPTAGTQTIFLANYDDLFAYGRSFTLEHYLAWGWGNILGSKLEALWLTIQTFIAVSGLVFLSPLILMAWIGLSRRQAGRQLLRPLSWYVAVLLAVMVLLFTLPAGRGSALHSSAAIWPWMMPLAAAGLGLTVDWLAKRLPHWQPARAKRMFAGMFVGVVFLVSLVVSRPQPLRGQEGAMLAAIGASLPSGARVMAGNPPMFYYHAGIPAISVPNEPPEVVVAVARQFQLTHLILDKDRPHPMNGIYEGSENNPHIIPLEKVGDFAIYRFDY